MARTGPPPAAQVIGIPRTPSRTLTRAASGEFAKLKSAHQTLKRVRKHLGRTASQPATANFSAAPRAEQQRLATGAMGKPGGTQRFWTSLSRRPAASKPRLSRSGVMGRCGLVDILMRHQQETTPVLPGLASARPRWWRTSPCIRRQRHLPRRRFSERTSSHAPSTSVPRKWAAAEGQSSAWRRQVIERRQGSEAVICSKPTLGRRRCGAAGAALNASQPASNRPWRAAPAPWRRPPKARVQTSRKDQRFDPAFQVVQWTASEHRAILIIRCD